MWHQYKILEGHFLHLSGQNVDFHSEFTFLYIKGARVSIYATHTHVIKLVIEGLNKLVTLKYMKNYTVNKFKKIQYLPLVILSKLYCTVCLHCYSWTQIVCLFALGDDPRIRYGRYTPRHRITAVYKSEFLTHSSIYTSVKMKSKTRSFFYYFLYYYMTAYYK